MTIEYQLEPDDFLAIAAERRRFMPVSLSRFDYFGVLPALGVGLAVTTQSLATAALFTVLFIASGWFFQDRIQRGYRRNAYSEENLPPSMRRWTAVLTDEGLRSFSEAAEVLYRWSFIRRVFRSSRYVHFEVTPLQTVHIPIRAFRDEEHVEQFIRAAQSYVRRPAA